MFTDSFYPLAGIIGFTITLSLTVLYIKIKNQSIRLIYGILFAALLYFISGGSALVFIASAITFELFIAINDNSKNPRSLLILFAYSLILIVIIFAIPSILRHSYLHVPYIEALISDYYYDLKLRYRLHCGFCLLKSSADYVFSFSKVKEKNKLPAEHF
jgi:hypothetical protein